MGEYVREIGNKSNRNWQCKEIAKEIDKERKKTLQTRSINKGKNG